MKDLSKGADAYLGKPFVVEELRVHIKNLIETRLLLKGKFSGVRDQVGKIEIAENKSGDERLMERVMNVMNKFLDDSGIQCRNACQGSRMSQCTASS